ncbi:hypothetical protein QTA58_20645 [Neorhizobium sp. CSC1952]|mgnify:CR=1 FL=1|uniref:Uncharacterized protein n=1 Tax=Xaviernesmea oryzae TaxID=464029 RepID=A0A1X7GGB2_9HYPH|nr:MULTISPECIES: hypothetical protein [Rhizobium/Agrobacterium group]WJR66593.1 hypothetical protein QTA58_20645 [Rhizobium sp. CSC1952]SMF69368.1 hypothetical protein SAMN02982989_3794 [Xaviernesmea oryzae]
MKDTETPTGLSPSADHPAQKRRKMRAGRGLALFIAGVAAAAFAVYLFVVVYGLVAGT